MINTSIGNDRRSKQIIKFLVRHIFCDLDNTLVGSTLSISQKLVKDINNLPKTIGFTICTARGSMESASIIQKLKLKSPQIFENGATVMLPKGIILRQIFLSEKDARGIINSLKIYHVWKKVCVGGKLLDFNRIIDYKKITKIALQDLTQKSVKEINNILMKYSNVYGQISQAANKPGLLTMDISNNKATKRNAINYVLNSLNINSKETIGIGDSWNDISLFNACGLKVATEDAVTEIKKIADIIIPGVDNDGVSHLIAKLID